MTKNNKDILTEIATAVYAKDTLEKIEKLLSETNNTTIKKEDIKRIIEKESEQSIFK